MDASQWWNKSWNPIRGCSHYSEGCKNCYAERMASRFGGPDVEEFDRPFTGFAEMTKSGPRWTGRVDLIPQKLPEPARWRKSWRVFISMSDPFHDNLHRDHILRLFLTMRQAKNQTFFLLTKRAERMMTLLNEWLPAAEALADESLEIKPPAPNIWLGISAENQICLDYRLPRLKLTRTAHRFVSLEPMLGPIYFKTGLLGISWVIMGGETGPGARPMHPQWAHTIRDQCQMAGVPLFFKQWGEWRAGDSKDFMKFRDCICDGQYMIRVGKKAAGRLLDGLERSEFPT